MSNKHKKKFIIELLIGLILTSGGISFIIYSTHTVEYKIDWIFWTIISAITINAGLLCLGSAFIHKVKTDLIRRQNQKMKPDTKAE